jgi:hypothetical protein
MKSVARKSRMISFRLEPEEYKRFVTTCEAQGVHSVSELARAAVHRMVHSSAPTTAQSLSEHVRKLQEQVVLLAGEIDRLAHRIDTRPQ